jgi:hypothetical protein
MPSFKPILMLALGVALATYALDCGAMTTPEQAMQCCSSMPCAPHGHDGQDCCKNMPSMHAPFVQSASAGNAPQTHVIRAVLTTLQASGSGRPDHGTFGVHSHALPIVSPPTYSPLRI